MKIKFETNNGKFLFCKVPGNITEITKEKDTLNCNLCYTTNDWITESFIPIGKCKDFEIIGFVKDLTEEQWANVVDYISSQYVYKNYIGFLDQAWDCSTATKSGKSLMDSLGVYLKNPFADEEGYPNSHICSICQNDQTDEWQFVDGGVQGLFDKAQDNTGNWLLIKYL